ncbi:MAG: alpha/beta hydrolase [Fluviicola sp.]|nr:alpha/beta hydrolase [Fluviicola sp.]
MSSRFYLILVGTFISTLTWALNPSKTYKQLPDQKTMPFTEHDVKTSDGATLKAWYFTPAQLVKTTSLVLICHNGEGNMADYLLRASSFTAMGHSVVMFDYRGFGRSSDFEIDNNMYIYPHFQDDVKAMIDFCRGKTTQAIDMYGWGIGAGLSLGIGWNRAEVRRIIADTPFLSMEDLEKRFSTWDTPMEVPLAGFEKKFEPIYSLDSEPSVLKGASKKVILIIGSNDVLFNMEDMKTLQSKQKTYVNQEVYVVNNPERMDNFSINTKEYCSKIASFLNSK